MPLDLYYNIIAPPCRVVMLFAKWLRLELNLIEVDVLKREHYKPEFLKLNPQHCIPTLVDGDVVVWESSAILIYLAEKYGNDDTLYPKEIARRAKVNQLLFYDIGTLMRSVTSYYHPILMGGEGKLEDFKKVQDAVSVLDSFLSMGRWMAGENITVADFTTAVTVAALDGVLSFDFTGVDGHRWYGAPMVDVHRWYEQCKRELTGYTEITKEAGQRTQAFLERFRSMRAAEQQQLCAQQQHQEEREQKPPQPPHLRELQSQKSNDPACDNERRNGAASHAKDADNVPNTAARDER